MRSVDWMSTIWLESLATPGAWYEPSPERLLEDAAPAQPGLPSYPFPVAIAFWMKSITPEGSSGRGEAGQLARSA